MKILLLILSVYGVIERVSAGFVDESWVCRVKTSCLECLQFPQCTWCNETSETKISRCFSRQFPERKDFCKDNAISYEDKGMSFAENAKCACNAEQIVEDCSPSEEPDAPECSGRGKCECGRCYCDPTPDTDHPTKVILGKYCEFDNFSCDEPRCNEGPYHMTNSTFNLKTIG